MENKVYFLGSSWRCKQIRAVLLALSWCHKLVAYNNVNKTIQENLKAYQSLLTNSAQWMHTDIFKTTTSGYIIYLFLLAKSVYFQRKFKETGH